ncbi:MAG: phosphatidylglycerophosphatase A [Euryarchaeota archaeon]|nr:phosphatidylglycerophosphatase A [Euryarchaeota archaeon]
MQFKLKIPNVKCKIEDKALIISSTQPLKILSSAVLNGGFCETRSIVNCQVPKNFEHKNPKEYLIQKLKKLKLNEPIVGLMTAANIKNVSIVRKTIKNTSVVSFVTAGLSNPATAGKPSQAKVGTINIITLIDGNLTNSALVEAVKTITEAKSVALFELDVRNKKDFASGTTTDAVVVGCTGKGQFFEYCGIGTNIGYATASTAREGVKQGIERQEGLKINRPVLKRLKEREVFLEDLIKAGMELHVPHPGAEDKKKVEKKLRYGLEKALSDTNIASLILAGIKLEEEIELGRIKVKNDPVYLVADEIIGIDIAEYLGGTLALFNFTRYDKVKPGILKKVGPILDDALAGLIAGVMTRIYSS